jgi:hypothetical protein
MSYFSDTIASIFLGGINGNVLLPFLVYHIYNWPLAQNDLQKL